MVSRSCFRYRKDSSQRLSSSHFVPTCSSHQTAGPKPPHHGGEPPPHAQLHLSIVPMLLLHYCSQWSQTNPPSSPVPPSMCTAPSRSSRSLPHAGPIPASSRPTEHLTSLHCQPVAALIFPASCSKAEILHVELREKKNKQTTGI